MSKPERGIPPIPSLLMKPTPHETPVADQVDAAAEQGGEPGPAPLPGRGRGDVASPPAARPAAIS